MEVTKKKLILIIWFICRKLKQEVQKILEIIKIWLTSLTDGNVRPGEIWRNQSNLKKIINFFRDYSVLLSETRYKAKYGERLKILTSKQMIQRLPIALSRVNACNTSKNLLNEIRETIYSLYWAKEITKKVCNNIMNSIKL